jgi:hypothetical protein
MRPFDESEANIVGFQRLLNVLNFVNLDPRCHAHAIRERMKVEAQAKLTAALEAKQAKGRA